MWRRVRIAPIAGCPRVRQYKEREGHSYVEYRLAAAAAGGFMGVRVGCARLATRAPHASSSSAARTNPVQPAARSQACTCRGTVQARDGALPAGSDEEYKASFPGITGHNPPHYQSGQSSTRRLPLVTSTPLRNRAVAMHCRRARGRLVVPPLVHRSWVTGLRRLDSRFDARCCGDIDTSEGQ